MNSKHIKKPKKRLKMILIFAAVFLTIATGGVAFYIWRYMVYVPTPKKIAAPKPKKDYSDLKAGDFLKDSTAKSFSFTFEGKTVHLPYRVYAPADYKTQKYPMVLFMHGSGQIGTNNTSQTEKSVFLQTMTSSYYATYPAILLAPQFPLKEHDAMNPVILAAYMKLTKQVEKMYNTDKNRLYVTGLSMGGDMAYGLMETYPDNFAAAVPISAGMENPKKASTIKNIPIWIFSGALDGLYPPKLARDEVAALKSAGSTTVKYTEYSDQGHGIWNIVYTDPNVYKWLFKQKK